MPAHIELRQLRQFVVLAEELHFSRAALRLNISQPGLSLQMKALETYVGVALLKRTNRSVELTPSGVQFLIEARRALQQVDRTLQAARRAESGELGEVLIGYTASAAYTGILSATVSTFRQRYPLVTIQLRALVTAIQLEQLAAGRLDVAFIRLPPRLPADIGSAVLFSEPVIIALPAHYPQAREDSVRLSELSDELFIVPHHDPGVIFNEYTRTLCHSAGFTPRVVPRQGRDFLTLVSMVSVGIGVAIIPNSLRCVQIPNVAYRSISGVTAMTELGVAFRKDQANGAAQAFIRHVQANALR